MRHHLYFNWVFLEVLRCEARDFCMVDM